MYSGSVLFPLYVHILNRLTWAKANKLKNNEGVFFWNMISFNVLFHTCHTERELIQKFFEKNLKSKSDLRHRKVNDCQGD